MFQRRALALAILLSIATVVRAQQPQLAEIISRVRTNELLYSNVEVIVETRFKSIVLPSYVSPGEGVETMTRTAHSVSQDGLSYLAFAITNETVNGQGSNYELLRCFDGEQTRSLAQDRIANVHEGRVDNGAKQPRPHSLLLYSTSSAPHVPLSDFLSSERDSRKNYLATEYEGEEVVRGISCSRIAVFRWRSNPAKKDKLVFWLAKDRNYIPIKLRSYDGRLGDELPRMTSEVTELRELEPGVWFPMAVTINKFLPERLAEKKQVLSNTTSIQVKYVQLHPNHPIRFFQQVEFPKDAYIYHVNQGKIVNAESPSERGFGPRSPSRRVAWLVGLILVGIVIVGFAWRVYTRGRTRSHKRET